MMIKHNYITMGIKINIYFTILYVLFLPVCYSQTNFPVDARNSLIEMHKTAYSQLSGSNISDETRRDRFRKLLHDWFDVDKISKFVLGNYWRIATPQEKINFKKHFEDYLVWSYADSFKSYTGKDFKITGTTLRGKTNMVIIATEIKVNHQGTNKPVNVNWRLYRDNKGKFKIMDISVENVSMGITRRKEFAAVISNNGGKVSAIIDALIKKNQSIYKN